MFVPKVAKAAPASTNNLARSPSNLSAQRHHGQVEQILWLQRYVGNQAALRLLGQRTAGPTTDESSGDHNQELAPENTTGELAVGDVNDPVEHEADRVASQVMRVPAPETFLATTAGDDVEESRGRRKMPAESSKAAAHTAPDIVQQVLRSPGRSLDASARDYFEPRFGADFSNVRVHTDGQAMRSAALIGARAYTRGTHIFYGTGERPGADHLTAHELAHVTQNTSSIGRSDIRRAPEARDIEADFAQRPAYPVANAPVRPPGTIYFKSDTGEASYVPYVIYRPEDIPSWLYDLHMKSSQAARIRLGGADFGTLNDVLSGKVSFPDPDRISLGDLIKYSRMEGPGFDVRVLIGFVDGGYRLLGYDASRTSASSVGEGFIESAPATGAVGRVLFANRVTRALARGTGKMHLEVGSSKETEKFHALIFRIAGKAGTPTEADEYDLDIREMARIALAWGDVLSPAERQGLAGIAAQQEPPTPQAAQTVFAGRGPPGAEPPVAGVAAEGPMPAAATAETMDMLERFRAQLRGNIRRPTEVENVRELSDPDVQARVLSQSFGFALTEGRLYRLERVGQGIRINEVVAQPIVQPIAAPVGPAEPFEPPIIEPQIVNLDPNQAIRIGENVIPPGQTAAIFTPGEFIIGYSPNQLVAVDPLTGHPLLGVFEGGQWYELLDPSNAPLDFDPVSGARIVNFGSPDAPIPAVEIDTDLGPRQTTFQRAPVSTVGVGVGSVIAVANELMKWVGATLDEQRATIAAGTAEFDLWKRLGAAPVKNIWDADRIQSAAPGADAQTGIVASWRFPYVADIDATRLRTQLSSGIKTYAEFAVLIASLGQLGALTQERGRWIVKVNRPQGAVHKFYDITEAMNTVEGQTLASADATLRDRLAARPQAERGRIVHIRQGATLYRSESESRFELRHQPLIGAGDRLGPNAWVREIRSGRGGKLFVEPVNADAYQAVALATYMILRDIKDVWRECKEGGRQVIPAELPSFGEGPLTSFQAGPETTGELRFGWTRYIVRPEDPNLAVTADSTIAFGELRAFWVSEDDTTVVADEAVASSLRQ